MTAYGADDMMAVEAARRLRDGSVCFVGIGLPSLACNLARATHAPGVVLVYESGTIGAKPVELPLSIGDGELAETADLVVSVPEMFAYWLQGGRIDVGFLGAARNPIAPILAQACARRVSALAATFTWEHEHERAARAWQAEWEALSDVLALTGGAAAHLRRALDGIEVDAERMRANLRAETVSEAGRDVEPEEYLGSADAFVDRALARHREELS